MRAGYLLFLLALAACQITPVEQLSYSELQALGAQIAERCEAQGFPRNSPEFEPCMKQESTREATTRQANYDYYQRRRASHVTCTAFGATVVCN